MPCLSKIFRGQHSVLPLWDRGGEGNDFCVISQAGGATAKLQEPGWGHIRGGGREMILGSQAGGGTALS